MLSKGAEVILEGQLLVGGVTSARTLNVKVAYYEQATQEKNSREEERVKSLPIKSRGHSLSLN